MNINEIDFHRLCLDEGNPFYNNIYPLEKEKFNKWIRENLKEIGRIESLDYVIPHKNIYNKLIESGYKHIYHQCHYSTKAGTILNEDLKYFTGFVERNSYPYPIITHSFNYSDNRIIDFARIDNPENPFSEDEIGLPHIYYGIEIPREFVLNYKKETMEDKSMNPLLYEWFMENNK